MSPRRVAAFLVALSSLAATPAAASAEPPSLLFVQETSGGELIRIAAGRYKVRLLGVSRGLTTFTDRPSRRAGHESVRAFVSRWAGRGFASDPPNAALVVHDAPASSDVTMLTLSHPRYDRARRTLTYTARPLDGAPAGELAGLGKRGDPIRPRRFGAASLFIDDAGASTIYQPLTLYVSNAVPGEEIAVRLTSRGPNVAFGTGPAFAPAAGLQVTSESGPAPLSQIQVNPQEIVLVTSAGAGSSSLGFSVSVFLAADANISTFYLRSASDSGVFVTASIANGQPQVVNQTQTIFSWNPASGTAGGSLRPVP
jgi:hypothetical protein